MGYPSLAPLPGTLPAIERMRERKKKDAGLKPGAT